ncbi:ash family protein [Escherichia coli]|nr:ash family protein [Escherichia coli]EGM8825808.1 ash family protein [Escherichia coli]
MSMLFVGSQKHSALSIFAKTTRMSALVLCGNSGVILLSVKDHQHIDSAIPGRYTVQAPYKTGAGIGVLKLITEHNRAHAVFSCHEHCYAQIMVGRTGPTSVGPGSVVSGNANPVRLTTSVIGVPCGEFSKKLTTGAVTMTTLPTLSRLNDEDLHKLSYVTTALRALRKVTLSDPQAHQVLVETLLNLQAERIRLADKANLHIHRLLNISGGHRHA